MPPSSPKPTPSPKLPELPPKPPLPLLLPHRKEPMKRKLENRGAVLTGARARAREGTREKARVEVEVGGRVKAEVEIVVDLLRRLRPRHRLRHPHLAVRLRRSIQWIVCCDGRGRKER